MMKWRLGAIVMKRYGTGTENGELCEIVSALDEPSFSLRDTSGHEFTWAQSLTRDATDGERVEYWKRRALRAEGAIGGESLGTFIADGGLSTLARERVAAERKRIVTDFEGLGAP